MRRLLALAVLLWSSGAQALYLDGNKVHEWCGERLDAASIGYVLGVVEQVMLQSEMMSAYLEARSKEVSQQDRNILMAITAPFCLPERVSSGQLKDVVCKSLRENPKDRHKPAITIAQDALAAAFPCKKR